MRSQGQTQGSTGLCLFSLSRRVDRQLTLLLQETTSAPEALPPTTTSGLRSPPSSSMHREKLPPEGANPNPSPTQKLHSKGFISYYNKTLCVKSVQTNHTQASCVARACQTALYQNFLVINGIFSIFHRNLESFLFAQERRIAKEKQKVGQYLKNISI